MKPGLLRRSVAEFIGTLFLLATVVGSGQGKRDKGKRAVGKAVGKAGQTGKAGRGKSGTESAGINRHIVGDGGDPATAYLLPTILQCAHHHDTQVDD
jgi:hypothetical protein